MAINLKATARYLNKYEGVHAILSNSTPFFNEDDWVKIAQGNDSSDLDMYIDALSRTDTMDYEKFRKDYDMEFANSETRLAALYNETYGDRNELISVESDDGTKRQISKYDFYKENIVKQNEYLRQQHMEQIEQENSANIFADIAALGGEALAAVDRAFAGTAAFLVSLADVSTNQFTFADWNKLWEMNYKPFSETEMPFLDDETLYNELVAFETDYTHFRDQYGELTTIGRWSVGAVSTAVEMITASLLGGNLVGLAAKGGLSLGFLASNHAGLINQVVYYAPIAGRSMSETQQQLISSGASYSTAELLSHTLVKTGLEVGIEFALDKVFGATGLDSWLFGRGTKAALKKSTWLRGLGRVGKDIAQESTEEVLQELSGVLADNVFGLVADENFGELSSFSFQNLVDAAVIAALVSGGHATLSVMKTPGLKIVGEDGSVHEMGKLAAYDYRLNIESFWDAYAEAEKTFMSAMSKDQAAYLPSYKRLNSLREQRNFLESEVRKTKTNTTNRLINELAVKSGVDKIQPDAKLSASDRLMLEQQLKSDPEYKSISSMENRIKELDDQIARTESLLSSETLNEKANDEHNRRADKIRKDYAESFTQMYAAAKMLASFSNQIGAERLKQANDILNKSTEYINSGKRNPVEMERRFNEMEKAVRAVGIVIPAKLSTKIKNAKMSKLFKVVKRNGKNSFDVIKQSDNYQTKEELNLERKVLEELLMQHSKCKTVILTDDGTSVANDDESGIIAVPVKELKLGSKAVLDDVAEQMLVDAVVNAKFKGITIDKISEEYKLLHPSFEGDVNTVAALSLFYDTAFFMHMLSVGNKDMYSFLSSLIELESSVVEEDAKSSNYKRKMSEAKKSMIYCIVQYLSVNPYADRKLDFLSKEQLKYIDSKLYSRDLMNTYIELGVLSEEVRTYLITKINSVSSYELSSKEKSELIKSLDDLKESLDRRSLVETLNSYYGNVWNYGYDGRTYLPTSTNANKIFNYFCYENGFTCADFMGEAGPNFRDPMENFNERNEMFKAFTGNTYELKITKRYKKDDPASGRFVSSYLPVLGNPSDYMIEIVPIVKEQFSLSRAQVNKIGKSDELIVDEDSKDYGFMSGRHKELVDELLSEELSNADKSFLSINDVISNTNYLSDTIKNKIVKKYGNLTPGNAFLFLKDYFLKRTKGLISLSLSNDNEVFFTDLTAAKAVLSSDEKFVSIMDNLPEATKEGVPLVKISDLVSDEYRTEIMNYSYVYLIDDEHYGKSGKSIYGEFKLSDDSVGIYVSKRAVKNLTDFKFTFLHELMHLYQYLNQENLEYGVFSKFKESDRKSLVNSVKKHVPAIFNKRNKNENGKPQSDWEVVKDFLYYCSGALSAFGSEYEDYVKFYPVIVKDNEDGTTTISLPWGKSFTSKSGSSKAIFKATDKRYVELASKGIENLSELELEELRNLVKNAASKAGFDVNNYYHGTSTFGFTFAKNNDPFWTTRDLEVASAYDKSGSNMIKNVSFKIGKDELKEINRKIKSLVELIDEKFSLNLNIDEISTSLSEELINFFKSEEGYTLELDGADSLVYDIITSVFQDYVDYENLDNIFSYCFSYLKKELIKYFPGGIYNFYAKLGKVFVADVTKDSNYGNMTVNNLPGFQNGTSMDLAKFVKSLGYDTLVYEDRHESANGPTYPVSYVFLNPNSQLKSSDLVTYDDQGNVVPLSKRFAKQSISGDFRKAKISDVDVIDANKHLKSKGQRARIYIGKKSSKGTNLEPFAGKYLSEDLQGFILGAGSEKYGNIDESLFSKIKAGTLTMRDVMDYFYNSDGKKIEDENTFRLINDAVFHNKFIKSFEQLDNYILTRTANYYAMRALFKSQGLYDLLLDSDNPELYISFMEMLQNNDSTRKKFEQISNRYWAGEIIDEKNLRRLYMRWFDGSVESAGYIAAVARVAAYQAWKTSTDGKISISLSSSVNSGKNGKSLTMEDVVPSKSDFDDFNRFVTDENSFSRLGKLLEAADHKVVMDAIQEKQSGADISMDEVIKRRDEMSIKINDAYQHDAKLFAELYEQYVSDDEELANALYAQSIIRAATGQEDISSLDEAAEQYDAAQEVAKSLIRPSKNIVNNLRSMSRTIRANLSEKERKLFLKHNSDLFDENLNVKKSVYQDVKDNGTVRLKSEDVLLEIEDRVRQLSKDVRNGLYNGDEFLKYRKQMESKISKLLNELAKKSSDKITTVTYELVGEEIVVDTDKEIPFAVKRLLETQITKTAKSTTQLLTNDTDRHVLMNMKTFIENNVEVLNSLTQEDVNEIIDFYMSSDILPNTNRAKLWTTVQQLMLGYLLKMDNSGMASFSLTEEQRSKVEHRLEFMVSTAATLVSTWKNVLNDLNVANEMGRAMLKVCDIELSTEDESELIQAIQSGDVNRIRSAKNKAYNSIVNEYKDRKKTIFDKLLRFERMAMLSGPGTWVRNQTSNLLVSANNRLAELVTQMFPQSKKAKKLNQYRIVGTKVDGKYVTFIKNNLLDNGLLELISDGLIKYDTRRSSKVSTENQLLQLIKNKLETELFDNESSKWRSSKLAQKFIMTMMSDKFYINKSMIRYLGKMMTEDAADVSSGLTTDIMDSIADAYVMAAQDYMHRPNFWTKMEQSFRTYLHKNFNATSADGIYFMYKQIFPFAGASWNWFAEAWNYTPFALAKGIYNLCKLEKTVEQMEEARRKGEVVRSSRFAEYMARRKIGKGVIGTFGLILGAILVATGKAGIDDDDDKHKLKINAADGPIYIDISDVYGSTGIILGMSIANCFVNDKNGFNYSSFMNLMSNSLNVMFLDSSFADLFNSFRSSESFSDYLLDVPADVASMLVPNFIKTIGNLFKKYNVRYSSGLKGQMERFMVNSFGAFSYMMPYKINPYSGDAEIVNDGWFALNLINRLTPIDVKNYNFSELEKEAVSLGIRKSQLTGRYEVNENKINLTSKEAEKLNTLYGKLNKQDLYDLMNDKVKYTVESEDGKRVELLYSKMSDKQKAAVIERIMSKNSSYAKIYILTSNYGYKYYAGNAEYEALKKLKVNNVYRKVGKYDGFVKV